jgi:hypothetical protein
MKNLFTILLLTCTLPMFSQIMIDRAVTTTNHFQTHVLKTTRGDVFIGHVEEIDSGRVRFRLGKANYFTLKFGEVDSITVANRRGNRAVQVSDFAERSSLMPTAFALEQGAIEYHNEILFLNSVNYGVRNNFTVGAGIWALPYHFFYNLHLKWTQPLGQKLHFAMGMVLGSGYNNDGYLDGGKYLSRYMLPFGALTLGSRKNFVSAALGKAYYYEDDSPDEPAWLYTVNAVCRPSQRLRMYAEVGNTVEGYTERFYNVGLGFIGKKSVFNLGALFGGEVYGVVPILSYSRRIR